GVGAEDPGGSSQETGVGTGVAPAALDVAAGGVVGGDAQPGPQAAIAPAQELAEVSAFASYRLRGRILAGPHGEAVADASGIGGGCPAACVLLVWLAGHGCGSALLALRRGD